MRAANITHQWIIFQNDQALNPEYIQKVCKCKSWVVMCTYMHNCNLDSSFFRQGAVFCNLCPLGSHSLGMTNDRYLGFRVFGEGFFTMCAMTLWRFSCTPKAPLWKKDTGVLARHWIPRRMCTRTNTYIVNHTYAWHSCRASEDIVGPLLPASFLRKAFQSLVTFSVRSVSMKSLGDIHCSNQRRGHEGTQVEKTSSLSSITNCNLQQVTHTDWFELGDLVLTLCEISAFVSCAARNWYRGLGQSQGIAALKDALQSANLEVGDVSSSGWMVLIHSHSHP